jgi:hypothetical protein
MRAAEERIVERVAEQWRNSGGTMAERRPIANETLASTLSQMTLSSTATMTAAASALADTVDGPVNAAVDDDDEV